jgi:hypothetical protein
VTGFSFPKPGERTNASAIPVPEDVLSWLTSAAGILLILEACDDPACATCVEKGAKWTTALGLLSTAGVLAISETGPEIAARIRERLR